MRLGEAHLLRLCMPLALWLLCGCSSEQPTASALYGYKRYFPDAKVTMWVPARARPIWDGHTSVVHVDETTPRWASVKDYKIIVEMIVVDSPQRLQQRERWAASDWYYQDHPELSAMDVQYGKQMRKDIWNFERTRRLEINAMIFRSATFEDDIATAKKMVESIKPVTE